MQEKSRILLFTTAFLPLVGGSEIAINEITKRLPDFSFDIITPRYRPDVASQEIMENVIVHRVGVGSSFDKYLFPLLGFVKGAMLVRREDEQFYKHQTFIHAFQASHAAIAAIFLAQLMWLPLFVTLQEGKDLAKQPWITKITRRWILRQADQMTAISNYLLNYARIINPKVPVVRIPNGIDSEIFHRVGSLVLKRTLALENKKVIITVSRLVEKNGIGDLIRAFAKVKEDEPSAQLMVIGSGPLLLSLQDQVRKLRLNSSVVFLGEIKYEDLPLYLSLADVFVRPSLSEGLGNAFLEAMACGVPVIGTRIGGIPDFIKDGETGFFCEVGSSDNIAEKIRMILRDASLASRFAAEGLALVRKEYQWASIADTFRKLYEQYVQEHTVK